MEHQENNHQEEILEDDVEFATIAALHSSSNNSIHAVKTGPSSASVTVTGAGSGSSKVAVVTAPAVTAPTITTIVTDPDGPTIVGTKGPDDILISYNTNTRISGGKKVTTINRIFKRPDGTRHTVSETYAQDVPRAPRRLRGPNEPPRVPVPNDHGPLETFIEHTLVAHNEIRARYGAPELVLNAELCEIATSWAKALASGEVPFTHSSNKYRGEEIGENIATKWSSKNFNFPGHEVVASWYEEAGKYDYDNDHPGNMHAGHFCQLVWLSTRELGVGRAVDAKGKVIVVCNYYPPGNVIGRFAQNVPRLIN